MFYATCDEENKQMAFKKAMNKDVVIYSIL